MTDAQAKWLRKLRDEGPQQKSPRGFEGIDSSRRGYMRWDISRVWVITNKGLTALAECEASK